MKTFLIKWTPRAAAALIGGYYGLGIAYDLGLMALIDKVAIQILKHWVGYAGVGALMPTVQWYSAWSVRIVLGVGAELIYDLFEKATILFLSSACSVCSVVNKWGCRRGFPLIPTSFTAIPRVIQGSGDGKEAP